MVGKQIVVSSVYMITNPIKDGENRVFVEADDAVGASKTVLRI